MGERFNMRIRCGRHRNRDINTFNGLAEDPLAIVRQLTN
jgi:hypothetical protein